jgi:catechol 2,3-dioxygenase-like lactoylglutathione lyase family enzyme
MSAIKPRGMVHACIPVKDLEISKKFYTEMLGLEFLRLSEAYQLVFLMAGKDYLILAKSETPINPNPPGKRRVHYAFAVHPGAAYDAAKAFLVSKGIPILDEELRSTGVFPGRQFYVEDPDRNVIEFSEFDGKAY